MWKRNQKSWKQVRSFIVNDKELMSDLLLRNFFLKWQDVFVLIQWDNRLSPFKAQLVYGMKIIIEMTLCFLATTF